MYNFAVSDVSGYSPEGLCHETTDSADPTSSAQVDNTKIYPTEELCGAVGECSGDDSYEDEDTCETAGYCFDPGGDLSLIHI